MPHWRTHYWLNRLILLGILLSSGRAFAQTKPTAVLVTNHADATIVPLLQAELESLGFKIEREDRGPLEISPQDLTVAARRYQAVAGFRVISTQKSVEIWIADRVTGKVVLREVLHDGDDLSDSRLVVLRAVELLRGSLMELEAPHPPRGEIPSPEGLRPLTGFPEGKGKYSLSLGPSLIFPGTHSAYAPGARANLSWWITPHFGAGLTAGATLTPAVLDRPEGQVTVSARWVEVSFRSKLGNAFSTWVPSAGVGISLLASGLEGLPAAGYTGRTRTLVAPAMGVDLGIAYRLSNNVSILANGWGALRTRSLSIHAANRVVTNVGRWLVVPSVGLQVHWP
jgi:hypothetical protein